jgi:hypothetical protein
VTRLPPHEPEAEKAAIGAALLSRNAIEDMIAAGLMADDFYNLQHQDVWNTIVDQHRDMGRCDVLTVTEEFSPDVRTELRVALIGYQNDVPAITNAKRYAQTIISASMSRSLIGYGADLTQAGYDRRDPIATARDFAATLATNHALVRDDAGTIPGYYPRIGDIDTGEDRDVAQPWVHRGIIRRQQRMMIVAPAGAGKGVMLRSAAWAAENGIHWFTGFRAEPCRALVVECEGAEWDIITSSRLISRRFARHLRTSVTSLTQPALLHRPNGLDIRSREGFRALESAIRAHQPNLLCIGPVKYLFSIGPGENYETAAIEVQKVINALVVKFDMAVILEHHSNRADSSGPGGSQRWFDWPDTGFTLVQEGAGENGVLENPRGDACYEVQPFRNPRDTDVRLPKQLWRGRDDVDMPWYAQDETLFMGAKLHDYYRGPQPDPPEQTTMRHDPYGRGTYGPTDAAEAPF